MRAARLAIHVVAAHRVGNRAVRLRERRDVAGEKAEAHRRTPSFLNARWLMLRSPSSTYPYSLAPSGLAAVLDDMVAVKPGRVVAVVACGGNTDHETFTRLTTT